jgi:outer membrane protein assembly factor BamE (lipoprotein component of BamABCDE complex)
MKKLLILLGALSLVSGCINAGTHRADVRDDSADRISVANVQREIKIGMSGADVIAVLGSPNMVTTDSQRRETWVYDKVATERVYSTSEGGLGLLLGGATGGATGAAFGGMGGMFSKGAGASSTSQRTLTIIIKFDTNGLVRDYGYRQSSF